ncbi:hypothetical protein FOMPIDRAFT_82435 [Fomitopsis schrenkii]|uniref:Ricin B lectin domain-containing protein n=1 Tax=Fomitopsis schrenkii TaxID=2126942 RepID=S8E2V5_FOMSC|nr:hypothetical protein FOMPIDRAFT_82435 [Fomitopsis schrenkii]
MPSAPVPSGVYFIQNLGTGTVLDLDNGSSANGTKVHGYQKRDLSDNWVPAQLWVVSQIGDSSLYTIENANSRTNLDLTGSNAADGTPIIGSQATPDAENQRWAILRNREDTAYVIQNKGSGTYVDLLYGNSANLTPVNGWAGQGVTTPNTHQLWKFVRA